MRTLLLAACLTLLGCATSQGVSQTPAPAAQAQTAAPEGAAAQTPAAPAADPARARELAMKGEQLAGSQDYEGALALFRESYALGGRFETPFYNAACSAALAGHPEEAVQWLQRSVEAGFEDLSHLEKDTDLDSVRSLPGYQQVVAALNEKAKLQDAALRDELLKMVEEDQNARRAAMGPGSKPSPEAMQAVAAIDQKNTARMKVLVAEKGWPTNTLVGRAAAKGAFLLVQHADRDPAFQRQMLSLLEQAAAKGEADPSSVAYLTDRVLVAEGKPQRYGTQFHTIEGTLYPRPLEAPESVDARRASVGLPPLADYGQMMTRMSGMPVSLEPREAVAKQQP